jgi:hypothetical protein
LLPQLFHLFFPPLSLDIPCSTGLPEAGSLHRPGVRLLLLLLFSLLYRDNTPPFATER